MRFLDEEYDGVVIKLPSIFIKMNNLESVLQKFKEELENTSKFSLLLLDYENSLYELENFPKKKEMLDIKKEQQKQIRESQDKLYQKYVEKIYIPYSWKPEEGYYYQDIQTLYFKNKTIEDVYSFLFPKGKNGKRIKYASTSALEEINNLFWEEVKEDDVDTYYKFVERNPSFIYFPLEKDKYKIVWRFSQNLKSFYVNREEGLSFRYDTLFLHWYETSDTYYKIPVDVRTGKNTLRGDFDIQNYEFKGNLLVKKGYD